MSTDFAAAPVVKKKRHTRNYRRRLSSRNFGSDPSLYPVWAESSAGHCWGSIRRTGVPGGAGIYVLGILLHFFIAFSVTAVSFNTNRRLTFMLEHPLVCGLLFGMAVELVMSYVVLPVSALHARGPYRLHDVLLGLIVHMIVIGLPVAFSVRRFAGSPMSRRVRDMG